jgi:hypothetical protein
MLLSIKFIYIPSLFYITVWTKLNITHGPRALGPPPKDMTETARAVTTGLFFLSGGLLMATEIVRSPTLIPSVLINACAAAA